MNPITEGVGVTGTGGAPVVVDLRCLGVEGSGGTAKVVEPFVAGLSSWRVDDVVFLLFLADSEAAAS